MSLPRENTISDARETREETQSRPQSVPESREKISYTYLFIHHYIFELIRLNYRQNLPTERNSCIGY